MRRIVVGADGSAGAANAMRWAARLAGRLGAELVVMTGLVPTDSELRPRRLEVLESRTQDELRSWVERADLGRLPVRTVVEPGDPRPGILAVAVREEADLIVVGRIGSSAGPGILHVGSLAEWLMHHSHLPVAVVGGAVNLSIERVLVGVDGSSGSRAAVDWVVGLAPKNGLGVIAASVQQPILEWTPSDSPKNWRRGIEGKIREDYASALTAAGIAFETLALRGSNVADALLQAAKDERTDIIVVGARGLGGFTGLRVGGVAIKTLHRADRPVVLIPAGES